jgi:hypothetical protein
MNTKHVTSLEISKQLAEAGIVIESEYGWVGFINDNGGEYFEVRHERDSYPPRYPAPIATEILERLPASTCLVKKTDLETKEKVRYNAETFTHHPAICPDLHSENPCDALALLLIRLTKDGLI